MSTTSQSNNPRGRAARSGPDRHAWRSVLLLLSLLLAHGRHGAFAQQGTAPIARWSFSAGDGASPRDAATGLRAKLEGEFSYLPGISGDALRFDGYTTSMTVSGHDLPAIGPGDFTVEGWVALDTYPWNWVPVVEQQREREVGFALELDAFGHIRFGASIDGQWHSVTTEAAIPLKQWTHLAGTYHTQDGAGTLTVFVNGVPLQQLHVNGHYTPSQADLLIGRVPAPLLPFPEAEVKPPQPVWYSLDGMLDDVALYRVARTPAELAAEAAAPDVPRGDVLPWTKMPSGPAGPGSFGAFYTTLHYEDTWDRLRQVGPDSDVVVRFDNSPSRLVFWQGTNYVPAWVTGDDKWYTDEFLEVWDAGCPDSGDCEPMSDKQARFSHVNILESSAARVVVHWRYALTEAVGGKGAWLQPRTGWTDWADEYWTVYPDGVAIRKQVLHSANLHNVHEWQETIVLHQPGSRPEDDIESAAITLGNMQGATRTYTWQPHVAGAFANPLGPGPVAGPAGANMQMVNLKSRWKPFQIVPPNGVSSDFYNNEKSFFIFECWNHWPVGQIASSDRACVTDDRPSHSSLSHLFWNTSSETESTATKLLMSGLTTQPLAAQVPLARSWISPPSLETAGTAIRSKGYDASQRAYLLTVLNPAHPAPVRLTIHAGEASPLANAALLFEGWGDGDASVAIDGKPAKPGTQLRMAHLRHLDRTDLLLWIEQQSTQPIQLQVSPTLGGAH